MTQGSSLLRKSQVLLLHVCVYIHTCTYKCTYINKQWREKNTQKMTRRKYAQILTVIEPKKQTIFKHENDCKLLEHERI